MSRHDDLPDEPRSDAQIVFDRFLDESPIGQILWTLATEVADDNIEYEPTVAAIVKALQGVHFTHERP